MVGRPEQCRATGARGLRSACSRMFRHFEPAWMAEQMPGSGTDTVGNARRGWVGEELWGRMRVGGVAREYARRLRRVRLASR